ncbi:glycosyltransferase family 9 protein [bacterium]|nr:glycosyltransferase family 9 protein [bacterium]
MKNILLFRWGSLGDLLVTFPSIYWLRNHLSSCWITLVGRKEYGSLLEKTGVVDELLSAEDRRLRPLFSQSPEESLQVRKWIHKYSWMMGWFQSLRTARIKESSFLTPKESYFFVYDSSQPKRVSRFFFDKTVECLQGKKPSLCWFNQYQKLPLGRREKKESLNLLPSRFVSSFSPFVVVHPGSGSPRKCWPWPRFLRLIQDLTHHRIKGILVTGPAEERLESQIHESPLPSSWVWLRNPSLFGLSSLISQACFYLGNDSGVTHLAALCAPQGLALFLKEYEKEWRPLGNISVLSADSIDMIGYDSVRETIFNKLIAHGGSATLNK